MALDYNKKDSLDYNKRILIITCNCFILLFVTIIMLRCIGFGPEI